jgi:segregation and condensation protein B
MELAKALSAILFYQAEPMTIKRLAVLLKCSESDIENALNTTEASLSGTGLRLIRNDNEVTLGTAPEAGTLIEEITKEELSKDLSKAALETLAIVLYKGPITRGEIDYVRGVNSTFILRNLLIRGLVEKIDNPNDQRSFLYKPTFALLEYMGVARVEDLPEHATTLATLAGFIATKEEVKQAETEEAPEEKVTPVDDDTTPEEEADVVEIDETGKNFDDPLLEAHREADHTQPH